MLISGSCPLIWVSVNVPASGGGRMVNTNHINSGACFKMKTQTFPVLWKQYYSNQLGDLLLIWPLTGDG